MEKRYKELLLKIIDHYAPAGVRVYLFGSRARKIHNPGSDIDIALDAESPIPLRVLGLIREDIENSNIPFFVDVIDAQSVSDEMKQNIKREGVEWKR